MGVSMFLHLGYGVDFATKDEIFVRVQALITLCHKNWQQTKNRCQGYKNRDLRERSLKFF